MIRTSPTCHHPSWLPRTFLAFPIQTQTQYIASQHSAESSPPWLKAALQPCSYFSRKLLQTKHQDKAPIWKAKVPPTGHFHYCHWEKNNLSLFLYKSIHFPPASCSPGIYFCHNVTYNSMIATIARFPLFFILALKSHRSFVIILLFLFLVKFMSKIFPTGEGSNGPRFEAEFCCQKTGKEVVIQER